MVSLARDLNCALTSLLVALAALASHPSRRFFDRAFRGPGHPVDRKLNEGDEVAGFRVIDVPGHSAGHVAFWRESDRVLVLGDVLPSQLNPEQQKLLREYVSEMGGNLIIVDGKIVGAIGVSGVTSAQHAQIVQAGLDAVK